MIESDGALSQSPRPDENDAGRSESQEETTEADDAEDKAATVTRREKDSVIAVASEVQTVNVDNKDLPPPMLKECDTRSKSQENLVAEAKGIYAGLVMVESKCIELDNTLTPDGPEADKAFEEAVAAQQRSVQDANLSYQEPQASSEKVGVAEDSGKDTVMPQADPTHTAVGTVILTEKTEPEIKAKRPETERPPLVENRPLHDRNLYKKVGNKYYMRVKDIWIPSLNGDQYKALIRLHRVLLHEHYAIFFVSQHPKAWPALRKLAKKYTIAARMWRHGIHTFLDLLYHRLPKTLKFTMTFITLTCSILSLLEETVPQFRYTWVECKGDIARYTGT